MSNQKTDIMKTTTNLLIKGKVFLLIAIFSMATMNSRSKVVAKQ